MTIDVDRYGVHWAVGDMAFLHQQRGGVNAIGYAGPSPFSVRGSSSIRCNHLISLNAINPAQEHLSRYSELISRNSLVRFMLPLPWEGEGTNVSVWYGYNLQMVMRLLKMSSPIKPPVMWMSMTKPRAVVAELQVTNVQPLVLAGVEARHTSTLALILQAAATAPRKLLILAEQDVPLRSVEQVEAEHIMRQDVSDLIVLPWETLGAVTLRAYMRREWDGTWFTHRAS